MNTVHKIIKTKELNINDIPTSKVGWHEISIFALSFDPKLELGTTDIYKLSFTEFDEDSSIQELRTALFLLQRWWNNSLKNIDANGLESMRKLLVLIQKKLSHSNMS